MNIEGLLIGFILFSLTLLSVVHVIAKSDKTIHFANVICVMASVILAIHYADDFNNIINQVLTLLAERL